MSANGIQSLLSLHTPYSHHGEMFQPSFPFLSVDYIERRGFLFSPATAEKSGTLRLKDFEKENVQGTSRFHRICFLVNFKREGC